MSSKPRAWQILDKKIERNKRRLTELEKEIDQKAEYLQENFRTMAVMSILPGFLAKNSTAAGLVDLLLENSQVRTTLNKLTASLFEKIGAGIEFLGKKFSRNS